MVGIEEYREWAKKYPNFMTPYILQVKKSGDKFIELSHGTGFDHKPIYGVSVKIPKPEGGFKTPENDNDSKMFHDKQKALNYFNKL